jgi:hypothetical protein
MNFPPFLHVQAVKRVVAFGLALLLLPLSQVELLAQQYYPYQQPAYGQPGYPPQQTYGQSQSYYGQQPYAQPGYAQPQMQGQPLDAQQLEQLVAPIALYPDSLVAEVLAASTYPQQIAEADQWRQAQGYAPSQQIAAGAEVQNWDPSVKGLTAFPQVLAQMDRNVRWTTDLGNAYYNQPQDVLEAVQAMRQRAQASGNLQSTPQENVSYDQGNIEVAPTNPQVVYVPTYNPWVVYGQPMAPYPGFSVLGAVGSFLGSAVSFGLGVGMAGFNQTPFGLLGWGLSWLSQAVLFNHANYFSHSSTVADWGFAHGGGRAFSQPGYRAGSGFGQARGGYYAGNRPSAGYGRPPVQQAYNHMQPALNTGRVAYGSSFYGGANRSGAFYGNQQAYRAPAAASYAGHGFGSKGFSGSSFKAPHSSGGGFHLFGGGHSSGGGHGSGKHHR